MPKRNDKRDTAKAEYVKRRRSGEKINLKEFAATLGVTGSQLEEDRPVGGCHRAQARRATRQQKQPGQEERQRQPRRRCAGRQHQRRERRRV